VQLRRWDDVGKVAGLETPALEHYRPVLEAALRQ
jgi:predicted HD phosphohydrolase